MQTVHATRLYPGTTLKQVSTLAKVTINDVAKLAGVSIKTVSRVTNNESSVKSTTREKVQEAIASLQYRPNLSARNLAGSTSYLIGLVYDNPNPYYVIETQNGILSECETCGYGLLIHPSDHRSSTIIEELGKLVAQSRLAGLILTPPISEDPRILKKLRGQGIHCIPVISAANEPANLSPCIYVMDREASYDITRHLIKLGHRKIAFLSGNPAHRSSIERLEGYKTAMADFELNPDPSFIIEGEFSFESGMHGCKHLLKKSKNRRPTAIFACNDEMAAGALYATRQLDINVPGDLSIAGFEDSPFARHTWPQLTTASQPTTLIARSAVIRLINNLRDEKSITGDPIDCPNGFRPELIVRQSTGPVPEECA